MSQAKRFRAVQADGRDCHPWRARVFGSTPSGSVSFLDGGVVIGNAGAVNGQASLSINLPTAGLHHLSAAERDHRSRWLRPAF